MRITATIIGVLCCACATGEPDAIEPPIAPPPDCQVTAQQRYDPANSEQLETFPDDLLAPDNSSSPTGRAIATTDANARWVKTLPKLVGAAAPTLQGLSGFAHNAEILFRFDAPMAPPDNPDYADHKGLHFVALTAEGPKNVPAKVTLLEQGHTLLIRPLRPLAPGTEHAVVMNRHWQVAGGGCAEPSNYLRSLLQDTATDPDGKRMAGRYADALSALKLTAAHVSAATVFTTHDEMSKMVKVASAIEQQQLKWSGGATCSKDNEFVRCERKFNALDYRQTDGTLSTSTTAPMTLPVSIWLPRKPNGPAPVILHAHGMNGDRNGGEALAKRMCPKGFVVMATDALHHGEHPTRDPDGGMAGLLFLGMDIGKLAIDPTITRGSFNQTTADRLQLLRLITLQPDVDDKPGVDLDTERIAYHGISLGGLLGPQLLALSKKIGAGVLWVAGGRLLEFATSTGQVQALRPVLHNLAGSKERFERMLPVAQTLMDSADPASWAPYVFHKRLVGDAKGPHLLLPVALRDKTVPPPTARALARALRTPHITPVAEAVTGLKVMQAPTTANTASGDRTTGYFQYDRITEKGAVVAATHGNLPYSAEGTWQLNHFLVSWLNEAQPTIVDPYEAYSTKPLAADK